MLVINKSYRRSTERFPEALQAPRPCVAVAQRTGSVQAGHPAHPISFITATTLRATSPMVWLRSMASLRKAW